MSSFIFPLGYVKMHKVKIIDFQLNRWCSFGYARLEDMQEAAKRIRGLSDWKDEMISQAEKALAENRIINATFYYRAAEFFTHPSDPDKKMLYDKFKDLFYNKAFVYKDIERFKIPYTPSYMPAIRIKSKNKNPIGRIVIHGGFDSYIEEFYSFGYYFSNLGYDVYIFEGPGQGAALKEYGLPLIYQWEIPVKAVLDYFNLNDVTLLGISMGGWLCFRAAAYESRIKRVIASSIAYDYMKIPPPFIEKFARWLLKHPKIMEPAVELNMKLMPQENWGAVNLMYITKKENSPVEASKVMLEFNGQNQKPELVTQDVLMLTGAEDHFIPLKMHYMQIKALKNARSVTGRIFTKEEQVQNHCQVGNRGLVLKVMSDWIKEKESVK
ncbi:MAG: alpha/beta fold hydrolase [Actinobacteria bacterium]|nr:alpha/beta fold hydrolase [Actinomycetota bacterium]